MTLSIALLLGILVIAIILFSIERIPADVVALGVLLTLIVTGLLPAERAFAGFGSDAVIMIMGLLILSAALFRTGVVEMTGRYIIQRTGDNANLLLAVIMGAAGLASSFISNTAATAFFLPVVLGISRRTRVSPSRLLMPLAFASILASSVTLVGTSTNIVISGLMTQSGMEPLGMFELTPVGLPILLFGLVYMFFIGRHMVPEREKDIEQSATTRSGYLSEILIMPGSPWIGKRLDQSNLREDMELEVVRIAREKRYHEPMPDLVIQAGDVLIVQAASEALLKIKTTAGIDIKADVKLSEGDADDTGLVESIVLIGSPLVGRTLKRFRLRERFGVRALAINRHGETLRRKISQIPLQVGDLLLIQGERPNINLLEEENVVRVLSDLKGQLPNLKNAPIAVIAFLGALLLAALEWVSFPVAVLLGVLVVFLTRTIAPDDAYRRVEWRAIILIASMLGLGAAMESTGTALFMAQAIIRWVGTANPTVLLSIFFGLTVLLTQPMSNQAAAVVVAPIAFQTALQLGLDARPFAIIIAIAASTSYLTPLEPACLMVYGPGNYRFIDFLKVGSLLTLAIYGLAIVLVPWLWPL